MAICHAQHLEILKISLLCRQNNQFTIQLIYKTQQHLKSLKKFLTFLLKISHSPGQNLLRPKLRIQYIQEMKQFFRFQILSLTTYIVVESFQSLLPKDKIFANNIDLQGEGFCHWKIDFLFCLNRFFRDCWLLIFFEKSIINCWMVLKCMLLHCIF